MDRRSSKFGWVISGTLIGAAIGFWLAQASPAFENNKRASREARLRTADRLAPFVFVASFTGAILGWYGERRLAQRFLLRDVLISLFLIALASNVTIELLQMIYNLIRTGGRSVG